MKVMILEDDVEIGAWVRDGLSRAGHTVDWVTDGKDALIAVTTREFDVLVLDRMVPGLDGLSLLKSIRAAKVRTPVLFLTALSEIDDRVEGLQAGADDYLSKPFAMTELEARVSVLGRRGAPPETTEATKLMIGDVTLDLLKQTCTRQGQAIDLNGKEFRLLEA
jgi:two-component system, OmpR family, response regulator